MDRFSIKIQGHTERREVRYVQLTTSELEAISGYLPVADAVLDWPLLLLFLGAPRRALQEAAADPPLWLESAQREVDIWSATRLGVVTSECAAAVQQEEWSNLRALLDEVKELCPEGELSDLGASVLRYATDYWRHVGPIRS